MSERPVSKRFALLRLALLAGAAGALSGLLASAFRLALRAAERWRDLWLARAHGGSGAGFLLTVGIAAATTAGAAWLVRRFSPTAVGSGIPHVEAVANGELPPAPISLLPVKFIGGWLAIGSGLALGREGPCVQMGASLGSLLGKMFRLSEPDVIALLTAGAGAGLATAFNAPIAGAIFVLEELVRRFDTSIAIAALGASGCAIAVSRSILGSAPEFTVEPLPLPGFGSGFLFCVLGIAAGLAGVAYNRSLLSALALADRLARWPAESRAAVVGASVGALAWFAPWLVGGGDPLTQRTLAGAESLAWLPWLLLVRALLGTLSYAAGTPGGLFAPLLVLGAQLGWLFGGACRLGLSDLGTPPAAFAVVGMAAFFTAVVRAPLTGIALIVELTGATNQLLPMLWACFAAMTVPTIMGCRPIYDALKDRLFRQNAK